MSETSKTTNLDLESALQSRRASKSWIEPVLAKVADIEARHAEEMRTREDSYLVALGQKSNRIDDQAEELEKLRAELAALEAKHQGDLDRTYQSYADSTNRRRKEHAEELAALEARHAEAMRTAIENAKREAYEDAAKMADNFQRGSMGIAAIRFREYSAMLREKAGKR